MSTKTLYLDNDNDVDLSAVKIRRTGVFFTAAAEITAKLLDQERNEVVEAQALSYVAASSGDFISTWDKSLLPSTGDSAVAVGRYLLVYEGSESDSDLYIEEYVNVAVRRE